MFQMRDRVEWTSQAGGFTTTKVGNIVEVVPAGQKPQTNVKDAGSSRDHESYVVLVDTTHKGGSNPKKVCRAYWPRVASLKAVGAPQSAPAPQPPAVAAPLPYSQTYVPPPAPPVPPAPKLMNHFVICLDESGSMGSLRDVAVTTFNQNVNAIKEGAYKSGQDATVTLVPFGGRGVTPRFICNPLTALQTFKYHDYQPAGQTPLLDAVGLMIDELCKRSDANDPAVSYVFIVITDGEENASVRYAETRLAARMAEVQKTDRWSFAFLLPPGSSRNFCNKYNIPSGNVQEWEATRKGLEYAARSVDLGVSNFYTARSTGKKSTGSFFMNMNGVTVDDLKKKGLVDLKNNVHVVEVLNNCTIREFVEGTLRLTYTPGYAYYQLMKPEKIQYHKKLFFRRKSDSAVYGGPEARQVVGLPDNLDINVRPGDFADWEIFVQSTSVNRKLIQGTKLIYMKTP